mmetsp:Transcript_5168/g.15405  ORF Transcript_5168/g.15405 Transcript_5168/m.15405 type:complete len:502 (+) Transcript_5168:208-1713(+)
MRGLCRPATLRNTRRDDSRAVAHPGSLVPDSPRSLMVHHNVVCTEVLRRHVDLVKEVLAELLARPILVVARLVLAAAEPAPLELARAAADVVAAAVLLGGDAALGARLRVGADPLGRLDLFHQPVAVLLPQRLPAALVARPPPRGEVGARRDAVPRLPALCAEGGAARGADGEAACAALDARLELRGVLAARAPAGVGHLGERRGEQQPLVRLVLAGGEEGLGLGRRGDGAAAGVRAEERGGVAFAQLAAPVAAQATLAKGVPARVQPRAVEGSVLVEAHAAVVNRRRPRRRVGRRRVLPQPCEHLCAGARPPLRAPLARRGGRLVGARLAGATLRRQRERRPLLEQLELPRRLRSEPLGPCAHAQLSGGGGGEAVQARGEGLELAVGEPAAAEAEAGRRARRVTAAVTHAKREGRQRVEPLARRQRERRLELDRDAKLESAAAAALHLAHLVAVDCLQRQELVCARRRVRVDLRFGTRVALEKSRRSAPLDGGSSAGLGC